MFGVGPDEWNRAPKAERARMIAYLVVETQVEAYVAHEDRLKKLDVGLDDFLAMDESSRRFQLDAARTMRPDA